jgi:rhodanese-related sulfurtransferase
MIGKAIAPLVLALILPALALATERIDERTLPQSKRSSLGLYITAVDAYAAWKANPDKIKMIDVRTPGEFRAVGLPAMAAKVPLSRPSQFVNAVRKVAQPHEPLLVICRSGNRSAAAVNILAKAGYKNAYTVIDGFEGDRGSAGKRTVNGWKNAGLPSIKPE